jgi:AbrB family looped-hinge helix DNA binding protein
MMAAARVTSKGQNTLPKEVRKRLGIGPGDEVEYLEENGRYLLKKKVKASPFDAYMGFLQNEKGSNPDQIIQELRGG